MKLQLSTFLAGAYLQLAGAPLPAAVPVAEQPSAAATLPDELRSPSGVAAAIGRVDVAANTLMAQANPAPAPAPGRLALAPNPRSLGQLFGLTQVPVSSPVAPTSFGAGAETVDSLGLGHSVRLAVEFSRDVLMANTRLDGARAQTGQSLALLLPSLTARVARGNEISSPASVTDPLTGAAKLRDSHNRIDTTLVLKQPILDLPGIFDLIRRRETERARELNVASSEGDAAVVAVQAYLALASTRLQADLAVEFEQQLKELLEYLRKRADAGASTLSDLDRVRARVLTARASRLEQEAAHAAAAVDFVRLANVLPRRIELPEARELGAVPADFEAAIADAFRLNPDLAAIQAEIDAAQSDRAAATAGFLPRVDLELSDFKVVNAGGDTGMQHDRRLMLVANWALFEGGRTVKLMDERAARRQETLYRLDDTRRRLVQTLSAQYATLASVHDRIYSGYAEYDALKAALAAVSERMLSGNQSLLDLLDVYDRVYQVRVRLVNLHVQELTAAAQIIRNIYGRPADATPARP